MQQICAENDHLHQLIREKEGRIGESEARAKELSAKAAEFEELFNRQLELVGTLQVIMNYYCESKRC